MRAFLAALILCACVAAAYAQTGIASVYGGEKHGTDYCGKPVAAGGVLHCGELTAAHRSLPFGTLVKVCRVHGHCVVVKINDRGPFHHPGRIIDLTPAGAKALGFDGLAAVTVEPIR
jgi:rare lipoprotein A